MAITISFLNFKGGVGKTTSTVNLAKALHMMKRKVLVVDADAQGNSSRMMGFRMEKDKVNTLYEVLAGTADIKETILMENDHDDSFDYVPATTSLYNSEQELVSRTGREMLLKRALDEVNSFYDYILIDCPPNNGLVTVNTMYASDYLIIPINCEVFALDGMGVITAKYEEVKKLLNPRLEILGYVLSRYDRRLSLHKEALRQMEKAFPDKVFQTRIRTNIQLAESPARRMNIFDYAPESNGAEDYRKLAKEFIKKIEK